MDTEDIIADLEAKAKEASKQISLAVKLKDTPEWKAFEKIAAVRIANDMVALVRRPKGRSFAENEFDRGFIRGMEFIMSLPSEILPGAMGRRKEFLLKQANELTDQSD